MFSDKSGNLICDCVPIGVPQLQPIPLMRAHAGMAGAWEALGSVAPTVGRQLPRSGSAVTVGYIELQCTLGYIELH